MTYFETDSPDADQAALYQDVRDNPRVKEIRLDDADGTRFILCHNPDQATRDQARRTADLERIGRSWRITDQST
ncbi:hypothetical protein FRACA_2970010 [Frankia canadensis]|uniref:Uncharacterized protein n=1 Tax=Frankia canadensis TaxID=1836972 RepID=A0A2I2KTI3_9ACTN|nr:hypothetical protein [Frankia canadensis]SNQ48984.1 hypothetical protein FRACA_2970010 [Frankia canadensis]SOU56274.1 hypothetical protein FRACA_2970010 [Frankia canadensis]